MRNSLFKTTLFVSGLILGSITAKAATLEQTIDKYIPEYIQYSIATALGQRTVINYAYTLFNGDMDDIEAYIRRGMVNLEAYRAKITKGSAESVPKKKEGLSTASVVCASNENKVTYFVGFDNHTDDIPAIAGFAPGGEGDATLLLNNFVSHDYDASSSETLGVTIDLANGAISRSILGVYMDIHLIVYMDIHLIKSKI